MTKVYLKPVLTLLCWFLFAGMLSAQSFFPQPDNNQARKDSVKETVEPIPLNSINSASTEAFSLFNRAGSARLSSSERSYVTDRTDSLARKAGYYLLERAGMDLESITYRGLDKAENALLLQQKDITELQQQINGYLEKIQDRKRALQLSRERWSLTLQESDPGEIPPAISSRIRRVLASNDSVRGVLQNDIDFLLTQADRLTDYQIRLDQYRSELSDFGKFSSSRFFQRDMPPVWGLFAASDSLQEVGFWHDFKTNIGDDTTAVLGKFSGRLVLVFSIFLALLVLVFWLKATVKQLEIKEKTVFLSLYVNEIFQKPIEVALLLGLYIAWLVIPGMPASYASLMAIVSVYAIIRIALDILPDGYRKFLIGFAIAYILFRFYNLFYDQYLVSRMILLVAQVVALVYLLIFINSRRLIYSRKRNPFSYTLSVIAIIYLVFMVIALAGNLFGTLSFSEFLSGGIIKSGFLIISTYVGFHVTTALIYLVMASSLFSHSNILKEQFDYIFRKLYGLFRFFFVLAWIFVALDQFQVRDNVFSWGEHFITRGMSIGKAEFSLINIVLFVFVIWLSLFISRIVRHILKEEVFPRVTVERGIPGTIIMLVRIALITIGFLLAAAAAGMQLSSLTIIIGAFSVGIGFGLQNIFNNLVSGLILAFERPIKEGDTVEVNNLLGVVMKIGIRSSVVRTYDGAEVIVPNGSLISNDLINWTLSDAQRRVDIRVGVAYGTDPEKVLEILLNAAKDHPHAITEPAPRAFFLGFGDSSLDFRVLAWTDLDHRLEMESEIKVAINRAIKEAGIEIPFPQTDLHIRSVDPEAGKNMK
ncbi:MAG: mechanosensitive ion channel [Bacteroidales bacterium]|nr:mechanosensitive ion channel [Bacteroidales bacterium]